MKLMLKWILFISGMIGVVVLNYHLLISWHPVEYYWTLPGILLSGVYSGVEAIILLPVVWWMILGKKGLVQKTIDYFRADEGS